MFFPATKGLLAQNNKYMVTVVLSQTCYGLFDHCDPVRLMISAAAADADLL
jgi:hypothetical protein